MRTVYGRAHCVIAPFRQNGGKLVPTSVIEGLACGCPAVVTSHVGVAPLIAQYGAGEVCGLTPDSLARAIEQVRSAHQRMRVAARRLAEDRFDVAATVTAYRDVYHTLCGWPYAS
jgi:glycosyltransferase involved in cell wall biosynthesis